MLRRQGFTLIELLIVMVLTALLLSISVPRYLGNVERAKEAVLRNNLGQLREAIDKHYGDTGRYPESLEALVEKKYLRKLPVDPITNRGDSWIVIAPERKDVGAVFDVISGSRQRARDGSDYASW